MIGEGHAAHHPAPMTENIQRPLRRDRRVQLFKRTGGGVARIGEERLSRLLALAIHFLKRFPGKKDFTTDFKPLGQRVFVLAERNGDGPNSLQVQRNIFAVDPISPSRALNKPSSLVN